MFDFVKDCWFLTGPTASGKTAVAIELAKLLDAEIVSMDSMSIYRGMDIGTAKPTLEQRREIPHHLIDIRQPNELFSIADYIHLAERCVGDILARGRTPLFVGGTPLYLKAMLRGLFDGPAADPVFRAEILSELDRVGCASLHQRLRQVDPLSASRLHSHDVRRIIRALEVYRATGQPISHLQLQFDEPRPPHLCRVFALDWPRHVLHERINARVDGMFRAGFVMEVERLRDACGGLSKTARQAVGYREVLDLLGGMRNLSDTIMLTKTRTRQFAKRQETWFRSLPEVQRVARDHATPALSIARQLRSSVVPSIPRDSRN
jgi:tRNA dimethylallyltransferase